MAPLRVTLRARDTTTGQAPAYADPGLSVTIRARPRHATTEPPSVDITGVRASLAAGVVWNDISGRLPEGDAAHVPRAQSGTSATGRRA